MTIFRAAIAALALAACGSSQPPPPADPTPAQMTDQTPGGAPAPKKSPFEQRRDNACNALAPKLTQCALEDAKADLASGKIDQHQFDEDTQPGVLKKNTEVFVEKCTGWRDMSSRQVRVLEVCFQQETQCGPLRECLKNLEPAAQ